MTRIHLIGITFITLLLSNQAFSQSDSITVNYSIDSLTELDYAIGKRYRHYDRNQIEEKFMLRFGFDYTFGLNSFVFVGIEKKLGLSSSINAEFKTPSGFGFSGDGSNLGEFIPLVKIGYNYFYKAAKKIRNGESANNLIGSYVSLQYQHSFQNAPDPMSRLFFGNSVRLMWGSQHRIAKFAYVGFNFGAEYSPTNARYSIIYNSNGGYTFEEKHLNRYTLITEINLGFALGNLSSNPIMRLPYWKSVENRVNELSGKMDDDKTMLKLGIERTNLTESFINISTEFGIEQKLNPSFSFLLMNQLSYSYDPSSSLIHYSPYVGLRFYHLMAKNVKRGLSGNNMSSNYFSINYRDFLLGLHFFHNSIPGFERNIRRQTLPKIEFLYGVQKKIKKLGYFDVNAGLYVDTRGQILPTFNISLGINY